MSDVLEMAVLDVKDGMAGDFERDFARASEIIAASPGYLRHELRRCHERPRRYLLLVWWQSVEAHEVGFRQSEPYQRWKALLHGYYEPFPVVEHYLPMG